MSSASEQHVDDLPSTSQDIVGKKKSRVKFSCRLCGGSHQNHIFPRMDKALKLLEDMTDSQPQLLAAYCRLTLNPPVVDGMINLFPSSISLVDQVVNLVTSLVQPVDKVVDLFPSSVDPILPLDIETQVVDMIPSLIDPTLPLESKLDTSHVFLVDTESTVLGGIPPSPMEPPPSNVAILFDRGALTGPLFPSHINFNIIVQVCVWDVP
jgi:hypothetical protein